MLTRQTTLVRSTLAAALLSAFVLAQPAHAGLLGGGGSLGGGLAGGLGGSFGPRSVDVGGQASGQVSRPGGMLPRGDQALQKAGETARKTDDLSQPASAQATGTAAVAAGQAGAARHSATSTAGGQAAAAPHGAAALGGAAAGTMATASGHAPGAATGGARAATTAPRGLDGAVQASAQASRTDRSVDLDASAQGSARR